MEALELQASIRTESGKGPARRLRAEELVPAVLYGSGAESILVTVNAADLIRIIRAEGETGFIKLVIDEGGRRPRGSPSSRSSRPTRSPRRSSADCRSGWTAS